MDYTDLYNFQTANGIIVPTDADVLEGIQTKFQEIFGTEIDLSPETPVGRLIEAMSIIVKSSLGVTAQSANQFNINLATGIYLDSIAQMFNIKRIPGTKSRIGIKCYFSDSATQPITINAGKLIMLPTGGHLFSIDSPIIYDPDSPSYDQENGRPFAMGTATAMDVGPIQAVVGLGCSIQTGVIGWTGVTTDSLLYIGTEVETDEELRQRLLKSRAFGVGFHTSLESALNRMIGVSSCCILDNNTGNDAVKKGIVLPPHSIYVGIDFIETDGLKDSIATAIANNKPAGVGMVNSDVDAATLITKEVKYGYGDSFVQTVDFYKVKRTPIIVSIPFTYGKYSGVDINRDVADVVTQYMETVGTGGTVEGMMIAARLSTELGIGVGQVLVQKSGSSIPYDITFEMMGYETPYSSDEYITLSET